MSSVAYDRHFLSRKNVAFFPYLLVFRLRLIHELSVGVLFNQFRSIVAKIGTTQFPLIMLSVQFDYYRCNV